MSGAGPVVAFAGYAGLLWAVALTLDAVGRRSVRQRLRAPADGEVALRSDVARFHSAIAGAVLAAAGFVLLAYVVVSRDVMGLLLVPIAALSLAGAVRRVAPLWRDP